jgi:drug/metabolite transporter (DMT)-like permease
MFFTSLAGVVAVVIWISGGNGQTLPRLLHAQESASFAWVLIAGLLSAVASLFLTSGLAIGKSAIVAPIAMSYGAVATVLSLMAGEAFRPSSMTGLLLCVAGAPLTALERHPSKRHSVRSAGSLFAVAAAFCYGAGFWMQGRFSIPQLGIAGALLLNYLCGVLVSIFAMFRSRAASPAVLTSPRMLLLAASSVSALACLAAGIGAGNAAVVTVLSALSGGVTALLGRVFRNETLSWIQIAGIVGVTVGAAVLSL